MAGARGRRRLLFIYLSAAWCHSNDVRTYFSVLPEDLRVDILSATEQRKIKCVEKGKQYIYNPWQTGNVIICKAKSSVLYIYCLGLVSAFCATESRLSPNVQLKAN